MKYIQFGQSDIQSTLEYWTDERMANAIPIPLPQVKMPEIRQQKDDAFSKVEADMSFCGFFSCFEKSKPTPPPVRTVNVNIDPYKKAGKLYFTQDGENYIGTAQFVGADNIIMTSAHCLKDDEWSTQLLFVRSASNRVGAQTFKVVVSDASVNEQWDEVDVESPDRIRWDYGFAKTTPDSDVGYLNLSLQLPDEIKAIGYSDNYGYMSKYMLEAYGIAVIWDDDCVKGVEGVVSMRGNFMEEGASGGAWFPRHAVDPIVGLNAGGNRIGTMFGPIFDRHTLALLNRFCNQVNYPRLKMKLE